MNLETFINQFLSIIGWVFTAAGITALVIVWYIRRAHNKSREYAEIGEVTWEARKAYFKHLAAEFLVIPTLLIFGLIGLRLLITAWNFTVPRYVELGNQIYLPWNQQVSGVSLTQPAPIQPVSDVAVGQRWEIGRAVNLRAEPTTNSALVAELLAGTDVDIHEISAGDGYCEKNSQGVDDCRRLRVVTESGQTGWVLAATLGARIR